MRRYLSVAVLIYFALLLNTTLWWIRSPDESSPKAMTFKIVQLNTSITLKMKDENFRIDTKPELFTHERRLGHGIKWQWQNASNDAYMIKFKSNEEMCGRNFIGYNMDFAKLKNVVIDPSNGKGRRGGESINDVLNQKEDDEYFVLQSGYFKIQCLNEQINYTFQSRSHLNQWNDALNISETMPKYEERISGWTIAVMRYEYVNLYHTMTDFYNTFLVAKAFNMTPGSITVLWIDGHPWGGLDKSWEILFGNVLRAGDISKPTLFEHMIWGEMGYHSPLNRHALKSVPYLEEFRKYFLVTHGITKSSTLECKRLNITVIWRRDYLAHPRKPSGLVTRKIKNEEELLEKIKSTFMGHNVQGIQIDLLNMTEQLEIIVNTDILVGMHGAGLSHVLFLPKHAGVVELYPYYWNTANKHFVTFARWRNIPHLLWKNTERKRELKEYLTIVNIDTVTNLIVKMNNTICTKTLGKETA